MTAGDFDDAVGELFDAHRAGKLLRQARESLARTCGIKRHAAADERGRDAPQNKIGIGDGRLGAAAGIAHRAGLGARAPRPDLEVAFAADPGDRSAAGADGLDVDHRDAHGIRADRAAVGHVRLAAFDQAEVGRGAAGIERHHVGEAGDLGDHRARERASRGTRQRRRDRLAQHLIGAGHAAARLHDEERLVLQAGAERLVHAIEIALHVRLDEGVDQGRDRALVLAVFRQHRAGERQRAVGIVLRENVRDAALVGGIGIGVNEADADGADTLVAEEMRGGAHARLVQRANFLAAKIQAPADLAHGMERHDALGLHPEIGIAVAHGYRLAGNFQEMAEAGGDDQSEPADRALQKRVGGDRRAVGKPGDVVRRGADLAEDRGDAAHEADRGIGRRARNLGDAHGARAAMDGHDIGEGAAGIDADPQTRLLDRW